MLPENHFFFINRYVLYFTHVEKRTVDKFSKNGLVHAIYYKHQYNNELEIDYLSPPKKILFFQTLLKIFFFLIITKT